MMFVVVSRIIGRQVRIPEKSYLMSLPSNQPFRFSSTAKRFGISGPMDRLERVRVTIHAVVIISTITRGRGWKFFNDHFAGDATVKQCRLDLAKNNSFQENDRRTRRLTSGVPAVKIDAHPTSHYRAVKNIPGKIAKSLQLRQYRETVCLAEK